MALCCAGKLLSLLLLLLPLHLSVSYSYLSPFLHPAFHKVTQTLHHGCCCPLLLGNGVQGKHTTGGLCCWHDHRKPSTCMPGSEHRLVLSQHQARWNVCTFDEQIYSPHVCVCVRFQIHQLRTEREKRESSIPHAMFVAVSQHQNYASWLCHLRYILVGGELCLRQ